nr:DUF262 domain-containing protein [Pseudonocardia sediminis]
MWRSTVGERVTQLDRLSMCGEVWPQGGNETKLGTILDQIDAGSMLLPEFQRGYVWNRDQVRGLMRSLYHGYPVGALLV